MSSATPQTLAIGITVAPRVTAKKTYAYTGKSIASFRNAGFQEVLHVFAEPGSSDLLAKSMDRNLEVHQNPTRRHCFGNWRWALEWLLANTNAGWIMLLQDDAVWRLDSAMRVHAAIADPRFADVGFLSPYTSKSMVPPKLLGTKDEIGFVPHKWHNDAFWGAVAIAMPRASAQLLVTCRRFRKHRHPRKLDVVVGNCFRDLGKVGMVYVPSLCDHIGEFSTLGRHKFRGNQWGRHGHRFRGK